MRLTRRRVAREAGRERPRRRRLVAHQVKHRAGLERRNGAGADDQLGRVVRRDQRRDTGGVSEEHELPSDHDGVERIDPGPSGPTRIPGRTITARSPRSRTASSTSRSASSLARV